MLLGRQLSREQQKALQILESCLIHEEALTKEDLSLSEITKQDNKFFVSRQIQTSDLPREPSWIWNQSRARKVAESTDGALSIRFYKLNTRKSKALENFVEIPQYKIWVYNITSEDTERTFIWCEKGENQALDEELLAQLSFLMPYVSLHCAEECGWGFRQINNTISMFFNEL